jgi:hypothetical protein
MLCVGVVCEISCEARVLRGKGLVQKARNAEVYFLTSGAAVKDWNLVANLNCQMQSLCSNTGYKEVPTNSLNP